MGAERMRSPAASPASDTLSVATPTGRYVFSASGATLRAVELLNYQSLRDSTRRVRLTLDSDPVLHYGLQIGEDTVLLDNVVFHVTQNTTPDGTQILRFTSTVGDKEI